MLDERLKLLVDLVSMMDQKVIKGGKTDPDFHRLLAAMRMAIDYFAYEMDRKSERLGQALKVKDSTESARKSLLEENKKLRERLKQKRSKKEPIHKSKPDPKTPQEWLSMPLLHFPTDKSTFPVRLKNAILNCSPRQGDRLIMLGDVLTIDVENFRCPHFGKVSAAQLRQLQNKWREEFGDDFEKELKIWSAS